MTRECHVRFYERLEVKLPGPTHHFGMKAHIGVDAESGLVHTVEATAANVHDIVKADALLHGKETVVYGDAGYRGIQKRTNTKAVQWMVAMCPGKRAALDKNDALDRIVNEIEYLKASVRAKVEHPFRVIKRQFGFAKTRYRGLKKNTAQLTTLFALSNLWMARRKLMKM
jgi:IS5 family transposase